MEQPMFEGSNAGDLAAMGPILAENKTVREFLEKTVGKEGSRPALELLKTGQLDEGLADLLYEAIEDEATTAWEGMLGDDPEGFSVCVMGWGGVFFVQTPEFDDVGYFRTVEDAVEYIRANWDDVTEM